MPVEGNVEGIPHDPRDLGDDRVEPLDVPDTDGQPLRDPLENLLVFARRETEEFLDQGVQAARTCSMVLRW